MLVVWSRSLNELDCRRFTSTGTLDTTFGTQGRVTLTPASDPAIHTIRFGSSGQIWLAGKQNSNGLLIGLLENGSRNTQFGQNGVVTSSNLQQISELAIDTSGITAHGTLGDRAILQRFSLSGTVDTTFGTSGVIQSARSGVTLEPLAYVRLANKSISIGGQIFKGDYDTAVIRFNEDLSLDRSFGADGTANIDMPASRHEYLTHFETLPNGSLILAGNSDNDRTTWPGLAVLSSDGKSQLGSWSLSSRNGSTTYTSDLVVAAEAVRLTHTSTTITGLRIASDVIQLLDDGTTDPDFFVEDGVNYHDRMLAVQANGAVIESCSRCSTLQLVRRDSEGNLDSTFGLGGRVLFPLNSNLLTASVRDIAVDSLDRILVSVSVEETISPYDDASLVMYRLTADGYLDRTFGQDGKLITVLRDSFIIASVLSEARARLRSHPIRRIFLLAASKLFTSPNRESGIAPSPTMEFSILVGNPALLLMLQGVSWSCQDVNSRM